MSLKKEIDKKRSIGHAAKELDIGTHVIRFWETKFDQIKPKIGKGGRRYYFGEDIEILKKIKTFLYEEGYTITGLQKLLKQRKKNQREVKKENDLQPLLEVKDDKNYDINDFLTKEEGESIQQNLFASNVKEGDKKLLVNEALERIESNLSKLQILLKN